MIVFLSHSDLLTKIIFNSMKEINKKYLLELIDQNQTQEYISLKLGCSVVTLRKYLKENNITRIRNRGLFLENTRFGSLVVLKDIGRNKYGQKIWLCLCDCGNKTNVNGKELINGDTKSCGCRNHRMNENNPKWKGYKKISGTKWYRIKRNAKIININF